MNHIDTAMIIGGGIAGPVTAMALQRAGIEATVYEGYATATDGVGGMLGLAPNGLDALATVGLDEVVSRVAEPLSAMVVQSWTGKQWPSRRRPPAVRLPHRLGRTGDRAACAITPNGAGALDHR